MKSQPVEFLEFVEADLRYAHDYYNSWQTNGHHLFQEKFRDTIAWIAWNPELFPAKYRHFRRAIIRRSYFAVFFVIETDVTTVAAVLDMRRKPEALRRLLMGRTWKR